MPSQNFFSHSPLGKVPVSSNISLIPYFLTSMSISPNNDSGVLVLNVGNNVVHEQNVHLAHGQSRPTIVYVYGDFLKNFSPYCFHLVRSLSIKGSVFKSCSSLNLPVFLISLFSLYHMPGSRASFPSICRTTFKIRKSKSPPVITKSTFEFSMVSSGMAVTWSPMSISLVSGSIFFTFSTIAQCSLTTGVFVSYAMTSGFSDIKNFSYCSHVRPSAMESL